MTDFNFTSNTASNSDDLNASLNMDPDIFGEEITNENTETIGQSEGGVTGDALVGNTPISNDNDPFSEGGDPFASLGTFEEDEDLLPLTSAQQDEAFHRLMEMSPEAFDEMMRGFPGEAEGPSSATPYAISNKRARRDEEDSTPTTVESAPLAPQPAFEPQQIHQIRQIREAKSRQGKAMEELLKRAQDLEADLTKSRAEANDAFENGRMVALLGLSGEWEAKEASIKADAESEHQNQVGALRTFLEGQIAEGKGREEKLQREANSALAQQHGQLEEANRQIAEKNQKLNQFRAEAEAYKTNVEGEARRYKQAAEEEIGAQKEALRAAESAKKSVESLLAEKTEALALAEPYIEGLEKKVGGAKERAENACEDQQKLLDQSQSYAKDLEKRLAELEKEQSSEKAAQRRREEELQRSGTEACNALEGKINDLEAVAEEAARSNELSAQATKGLNEELRRVSGDLEKVQLALKEKADELEKARSAQEEQVKAHNPQQARETRSIVGPVEQVNVEPSDPAPASMASAAKSFTFVAAKQLPLSLIESRQIQVKKSRRQLEPQSQPEPESQSEDKQEQEQEQDQEQELKHALPSQSGMFSHHFYPPPPDYRPRRSHIHAEEAIRNRLHIPLGKVHTIVSKLDQIGDWQDGMAEEAGLIISAELTGLSIDDLKVMQSLRTSIPGSSRNPRKIMSTAQLEIPMTLVDLLATNDRPAIRAFLDGASFPQSQASNSNDIAGSTDSRGTQTEAWDEEAEGDMEDTAEQEEVAVVLPNSKQTRGWPGAAQWKIMIFMCLLWLILPLLLPLPWSSPAAWLFEDPDPNSGWLNYVPEPSPWSNLLRNLSSWPIISKFFDIFFDQPDLESNWCGNIPVG